MNHTSNYILKQNQYILKNKYFSGKKNCGNYSTNKLLSTTGYKRDIQEIHYSLLKFIV